MIKLNEVTKIKLIKDSEEEIILEKISNLKVVSDKYETRIIFDTKKKIYDKFMCNKYLVVIGKDEEIKKENETYIIKPRNYKILNKWLSHIQLNDLYKEQALIGKQQIQDKLDKQNYNFDVIEWNGLEGEVVLKCRECEKELHYKKGKTVYSSLEGEDTYFTGYCNHIV